MWPARPLKNQSNKQKKIENKYLLNLFLNAGGSKSFPHPPSRCSFMLFLENGPIMKNENVTFSKAHYRHSLRLSPVALI